MGFRSCFAVPVVIVLLVIGFVYCTIVFLVIDPWLDLSTSSGLLNALVLSSTTLMALFSYGLAVLRDPGQIPSSYLPDVEESEPQVQEVKHKGGAARYCQKCKVYKPPRAHHCRTCQRCVLRMDHHCAWINNCVGHSNYKAFFLFLFYVTLACHHSLVLLGAQAFQEFASAYDPQPVQPPVASSTIIKVGYRFYPLCYCFLGCGGLQVFCSLLLVPLSVALSVLLGWHIILSLQNKTTIEYYEGVRTKWQGQKPGVLYRHPYDLGSVENMLAVLGPKVSCWCCPSVVGHIGTGLQFKVVTGADQTATDLTAV